MWNKTISKNNILSVYDMAMFYVSAISVRKLDVTEEPNIDKPTKPNIM